MYDLSFGMFLLYTWSTREWCNPFGCNCIAKYMINPRISADWCTSKTIEPFTGTPSVQEVHTKAEVVPLTPALLGLGVLFNCHA